MLVLEINRISNPTSYFGKTISLTPYQALDRSSLHVMEKKVKI
jgi:hypothetical protein